MRIEVKLSQKLEVRQVMSVKMRTKLEIHQESEIIQMTDEIRAELDEPADGEILWNTLKIFFDGLPQNNPLKQASDLFCVRQFITALEHYADECAMLEKRSIRNCVLYHMHKYGGGRYQLQKSVDGNIVIESIEIDFITILAALDEPEQLRTEVSLIKDSWAKDVKSVTSDSMKHERELSAALIVAEQIRSAVEGASVGLTYILQLPQSRILEQLRGYVIARRFKNVFAERVLRRFFARVQAFKNKSAKHFENAFLNTIGEYTLIALGVLDESLFSLQSVRSTKTEIKNDEKVEEENSALRRMFGFRNDKTIFWNRWALVGVTRTIGTDNAVRKFIAETLRQQKELLLASTNFPEFWKNVQEIMRKGTSQEGETLYIQTVEALIECLNQAEFKKGLLRVLTGSIYPELGRMLAVDETRKRVG